MGLYRDGDLIMTDTDIDFAAKGYEGIDKDLLVAMEGYEYILYRYKKYPMQMVFKKDDTIIDFYFHYEVDGQYINIGSEHD
ncbi:MAG TPA: hypothetical protein DHV62_04375, partial [Elusimicrobia bacterium]|nr:hypothetical protein [Elusimicrobiota bacterium]